jgi:hypothetical protein
MSSDVLISSLSAVLAQVNDVYAIIRFKKFFGKCVARTKVLRNVTATSKMTRDNINEIIISALIMFWKRMTTVSRDAESIKSQKDVSQQGSALSTNTARAGQLSLIPWGRYGKLLKGIIL